MPYLTDPNEIKSLITKFASAKILWADTEVADYKTKKPRLSLIQVLADSKDLSGEHVYTLDVLDKPELAQFFIEKIMVNPSIEKIFHNASYDLKFLGKNQAKNVTCTLEMAKKIPYYLLQTPNLQLKTLAVKIGNFSSASAEEQGSDWGQRPLTDKQLYYANMDPVYLAQVHHRLLELSNQSYPDPAAENLTELAQRYQEIEQQWKLLDSEMNALQERVKNAMKVQNLAETPYFKLSSSERTTIKAAFAELAKLVQTQGLELDFPITLTQALQKELGEAIDRLPVQVEKNMSWRLIAKSNADSAEEE